MEEIKISCSLEGRDLAVVKSLLNIKSVYNDISYRYIESSRACDFLIIKEYLDDGSTYYGLNKSSANKTPILPTLNPKTLQEYFNLITQQKKTVHGERSKIDNLNPFVFVLLNFIQSDSNEKLVFQSLDNTVIR